MTGFGGVGDASVQRPDIVLGWKRSSISGLEPGMEVRDPTVSDIDRHSRLLRAADPVLDSLADQLSDTRFSVLLADRNACIVGRRLGGRAPERGLERVKAVPGAHYVEEVSGTNSLATPFETRQPISVSGPEHFLEALRVFSCYGAPIIHPISGRIEGVLDITGPQVDQNDLLKPFLLRAVADIGDRLRIGARRSDQHVFAEFQARSARSRYGVVAFGRDVTLANNLAQDLLADRDMMALRTLVEDGGTMDSHAATLWLESGVPSKVAVESIPDSNGGVIVEIAPECPDTTARGTSGGTVEPACGSTVERVHDGTSAVATPRVVIAGEPGTGRTTRAVALATQLRRFDTAAQTETGRIRVLDGAKVGGLSEDDFIAEVVRASAEATPLVLDNVNLLPASTVARVRSVLREEEFLPVIFVCRTTDELDIEQAALTAMATEVETLPPLRDRIDEFDVVATDLLAVIARQNHVARNGESAARPPMRIVPRAVRVLMEQEWPGNLTELASVLRNAARGRSTGDITIADLPPTHSRPAPHRLTIIERAERATIVRALEASNGNKKLAAERLGLGRTTLYKRLRRYGLEG